MKHIQICDFIECELDLFRRECNFTPEELEFFNLRAQNMTIQQIAELMEHLRGLMDNADNDRTRSMVHKWIEQAEREL